MECVANFEIKAECSVVADDFVLRFKHPKGHYRARIKNITRDAYATPFLLSLHLYFEVPELDSAKEVAHSHLADCLNMLSFVTSGAYRLHRIRSLVEAKAASKAMSNVLLWSESIKYEDPVPFLDERTASTMERLSDWDIPGPIRRAMRWYRLGVNAPVPDDQFMNFWFALEIVAEFKKSTEKVASKCARCKTPLYCESCKTHPLHKPYVKEAIQSLLESVDPGCGSETIKRLDKTRNGLMHGETLKEIEGGAPEAEDHVVDILGRLIWKALAHQFPPGTFSEGVVTGVPQTYLHHRVQAVAHLQTVVPTDTDGDLILDFTGTSFSPVLEPPQSALPRALEMSKEQYETLARICLTKGPDKEMCQRICDWYKEENGRVRVRVLSTDMERIKSALENGETGEWQDFFRGLLEGRP